jgi:hypothetical protein
MPPRSCALAMTMPEMRNCESSALYTPIFTSPSIQGIGVFGCGPSFSMQAAQGLAEAQQTPWNTGTIGLYAGALMRAGERGHAEELLQNLLPEDSYGAPLGLLVYSVMCAEIEQAANWAWKVIEQRDPRFIFNIALLRSPSHSLVRSSGSWSALAARLDIPLPGTNRRTKE